MSARNLIALVDRLRTLPAETEWCEYKRNNYEPQQLGEYLSALANAACLLGQPQGYLLFGIDDETHEIVGTQFDPYTTIDLRPNRNSEKFTISYRNSGVRAASSIKERGRVLDGWR